MNSTGHGAWSVRAPTEIRLAVEKAFDEHGLIDYACAEIERLERIAHEAQRAADKAYSWAHCSIHGPGSPRAWGCPECIVELRKRLSDGTPRWIPLSERIPTEEGRYAILYRYKQTGVVKAFIGDFLGDGWSCEVRDSTITHWMPLPPTPHSSWLDTKEKT